MTNFTFGRDENGYHRTVCKSGEVVCTCPVRGSFSSCIVMPKEEGKYCAGTWHRSGRAGFILGTMDCCDGYLMAFSEEGTLEKIVAVDFNIYRIIPIFLKNNPPVENYDRYREFGLLVSGGGCSGMGVRYVDFDKVTPTVTPVVSTEECVASGRTLHYWTERPDPLVDVPDIWDRLARIGLEPDRMRTEDERKHFAVIPAWFWGRR